MRKNYAAPKLMMKGSVVEITKAVVEGVGDPGDPHLLGISVGGAGFYL